MLKSVENLRDFCADINVAEINDHIKASCDKVDGVGIVTFGINPDWVDGWHRAVDKILGDVEREYMALPLDADGVPIRVGDVMQFRDDAPVRVDSIGNSRCYVNDFGWFGGNGGFYGQGTLKHCHHYHEPTVEDLLRDFLHLYTRQDIGGDDKAYELEELRKEYAAKLRLAGDGE